MLSDHRSCSGQNIFIDETGLLGFDQISAATALLGREQGDRERQKAAEWQSSGASLPERVQMAGRLLSKISITET